MKNLPLKLLFLITTPLVIALLLTYIFITQESKELSKRTLETLETFLIDSRRRELVNYSSIADSAVHHIYGSADIDNHVAKELVAEIFTEIRYNGKDGYFFIYDDEGINIAHPKQPFRIGESWWDLEDQNGVKIIQTLIETAKNGGGFYQYPWDKPSSEKTSEKISYSWYLSKWDWMIGTGVYLDDIEEQLAVVQGDINAHIRNTEKIILAIALSSAFLIFLIGLIFTLKEKKQDTTKLNILSHRIINLQEEERRRISHEMHDGIVQILVSIKYSLEATKLFLQKKTIPIPNPFFQASENLNTAIQEIRRISHDLHPRILAELGLSHALDSLTNNFSERTGISVELVRPAVKKVVNDDIATTLYRVAQESLINIERHSQATKCKVHLFFTPSNLILQVCDNGSGFNKNSRHLYKGIGIRNLTERLEYQGGEYSIESTPNGTDVTAIIPRSVFINSADKEVEV